MKNMQTANLDKQIQRLLPGVSLKFEPELFRNFISYWLIRKSISLDSKNNLNEMKTSNPSAWLNLIESNHKFRSLYGEDVASTLIRTIIENHKDV